jgi:hypothetical protein
VLKDKRLGRENIPDWGLVTNLPSGELKNQEV